MARSPLTFHKAFRFIRSPHVYVLSLLALFILRPYPTSAAVFVIDGVTRLNTIKVPHSGVHHIRFTGAGYQNPGSLELSDSNSDSDSLIFERATSTDSSVNVNGVLLQLQGQKGTVVIRGLAFRLMSGGEIFDSTKGFNHNLHFDNCQVTGEGPNTRKIFTWGGDGASSITVSNSMFSQTGVLSLTDASSITVSNSMFSQTGALSLTGASSGSAISLINNLFNFSGVLEASYKTSLKVEYNTVNKTQFSFLGSLTSTYSIKNNYFGNPPVKNNIEGADNRRYIALVSLFKPAGSSAINNVRYASWDGFDYPQGPSLFSDPTNTTITPTKDSTVAWDWKIPGDITHGAWNGPTPLPTFNLFPPDSTVSLSVPGGNAVFTLNSSPFPRVITTSFGSTPYATALPDSARSWFGRDTTLVLSGPATVRSLSLPSRPEGRPILFSKTGTVFLPGPLGAEGGASFANAVLGAKEFLPAFVGQNTFRGSNISVAGISSDTALIFSTVHRSGRTTVRAAPSFEAASTEKRWRLIQKSGKAFGFQTTTNAEASGDIRFGFGRMGVEKPFVMDSTSWWLGGNSFASVSDSGDKYWGKADFAPSIQAVLIERLAVGWGSDTLILPQGRIVTLSSQGHQLKVDSSYQPDQTQFPDMGAFSKGIAFTWAGRGAGDRFALTLKKSHGLQKAYLKNGTIATALSPIQEDTASVTIAFGIGDSAFPVFLALPTSSIAPSPLQDETLAVSNGLPNALLLAGLHLPWGESASAGHLHLRTAQGQRVVDQVIPRSQSQFSLAVRQTLFGSWRIQDGRGRWRRMPFVLRPSRG